MKRIFKGHSPWGFLSFRHENQEPSWYLTGYTPVKKIHKAASMGDIAQVQRMLEFGDVDVNITDRKKRTALHYACAHGQSEMVTLLLWYACNIEARDREESTALIKATQRQHEECVKILLENGADPNPVDINQSTALHYAVYNNTTSIAARLLAFNADTETKTKNGYTPLILAVLENKQEMVELLLQAAANINALDNCKRSALIHAMRAQSKNIISLLLQQGADASLMDVYGATAQSHTGFEAFQELSKGSVSKHLEPTTGEDGHNFGIKDDCTPCTYPTQDSKERMAQLPAKEEENTDAADKLGSLAHKLRNPKPTTEEDEHSFNSKSPEVQSPMLTESSLWIGYPADWPEPVRFSRQPAVYNPTEWREDMESRSVALQENQHPASGLSGKEENSQTQEQPARVSKEPGANDCDPTEKENAEDKDELEKHPLAQGASQHQVKQTNSPRLQLQEQVQEPEMNKPSDGEDTSGHSRSAKGPVLRGALIEGDTPERKDALRLAVNQLNQKVGEICEPVKSNVRHEEEPSRDDCSGTPPVKSASPKLAGDKLNCEDGYGAAALVSEALQTFPGQKEGGLGNVFPSPSSSQVVENSGQSTTKFPLMKTKLDCENNKFEIKESLHKCKEKSSKNIESRKVRGKCPEVCMGEKQEGCEFRNKLQKTMKPKCRDCQLDIRHMPKSSESKGLSDSQERSHVSELKSWGDSTLYDTYKKSKSTGKPLHSKREARVHTAGTVRAKPPGGRTVSALADEDSQDRLPNKEFRIVEEEILAWEKVHLENEDKVLSKTCPQTQNASAGPARPTPPQSQKESTQIHPPPLHLEKMSEDRKINKKCDGECAPVLPEASSVKAYEKATLTGDLAGNYREPDKRSCELQPTAGHVFENFCSDEEPLPGSHRGRTQFKVEEMSKKWPSLEVEVSEKPRLVGTGSKDSALLVERTGGKDQEAAPYWLTKRQAAEKHKMETQVNQVNEMEEANSQIQPSATASGNDSDSLLKLWHMIHSNERQVELKNSHYELLRKLENMENMASEVQREQMEIKKIKSWLQHKGVNWEEVCTLSETQENAESMFQQEKTQLSRIKEPRDKNAEWTQHPETRMVITDIKAAETGLRQLQGPQGQCSQTVWSSEKTQAILQRLEVRISKLKITLKERSAIIEQIQNQLLHGGLLGDEMEELIQQAQSLECTLEKQMDKNENLMTELAGFKKFFEETKKKLNKLEGTGDLKTSLVDMHIPSSTLRHELYKLKENWETTYYKYLHMVVKLQIMEQELIAIKTEQRKSGCLLEDHQSLQVLPGRSWAPELATQARDQNNTEDLRDTNGVVTLDQMELRIKNLESLHEGGVREPEHHYAEESGMIPPLRTELGEQAKWSPRK
ncbi:ankyrin repeat domain-containing protein 30A-like [Mesocricetus auratus]|uniref:Ankyrin repeat domain-containing protein 30A-like n=1 Tax=Mesocricetus auratus TaxID=10036 RepID=A0ABM2XNC0_MESAU|nr:ankyrin repeat domain-containing protein 30A-like [Mesocricetus auratus]